MEELSLESKIPHDITYSKHKDAPWCILVNGLFAGMESWKDQVKELSKHYNVLRYDSFGQGRARPLRKVFSLEDQVIYLKMLVQSLKLERFVLIGISNGGRVSLKFAELFPELVTHVIAADTYDEMNADLNCKISSWLAASEIGGNELRFNVSTPWIFGESLINSHPELIEMFKQKAKKSDPENAANLIRSALLEEKVNLSHIEVPVDFLVGSEDILTTLSMHKKMHHKLPGSGLTIVKGGHASLLVYPENISKYVIPILCKKEYLAMDVF